MFPEFVLNVVGIAALASGSLAGAALFKKNGKMLFAAALVLVASAGFAFSTYILS